MKKAREGKLTIQAWSARLVLACLLPAAIASSLLIWQSYQREWATVKRTTLQTARALVQAVDRDLASAQGALLALATSPSLQTGDLASFDRQAREVLRLRRGHSIILSDRRGRALVDTRLPFGAPGSAYGNPRQLGRVLELARPAVSDLYRDVLSGRFLISVDVPVFRGSEVIYDLSLQLSSEHLADILRQQRVAPGRIASIFDSTGTTVARTLSPERFVGMPGAPALMRKMTEVAEGVVRTPSLEGIEVFGAFSRSSISNWAVAIGVPLQELSAGLWKSLTQVVAGTLLLLLAALLATRAIGRRITDAIRSLIPPAMALGHGEPVAIPDLGLQEAAEVGEALAAASRLMKERTSQRDEAEKSEGELRRVQRQLEQSEALQRGIFEEGPDAILLVAPSGRIMRANQEAERLFGHSRQRLLEMTVEDLMPASRRERHSAQRAAYLAAPRRRTMDRGPDIDLVAVGADGTEFPVDVMLSPLHSAEGGLVIATVRDITERRQKEAAIRAALREKETLLRELYHRVKNNLQVISSLFNLQVRTLPEGLAQEALKEGASRVRAMALVHEKLYQSANLASVSLANYVSELGTQLGQAFNAEQRHIALAYDAEPVEAGLETAVPLGLILNELICNALKHGFPKGGPGTITVSLGRTAEGLELAVADDGIGLPPGFDVTSGRSLGLKLVDALAAQLDGRLSIEGNRGTRVRLAIPVRAKAEPEAGHRVGMAA